MQIAIHTGDLIFNRFKVHVFHIMRYDRVVCDTDVYCIAFIRVPYQNKSMVMEPLWYDFSVSLSQSIIFE